MSETLECKGKVCAEHWVSGESELFHCSLIRVRHKYNKAYMSRDGRNDELVVLFSRAMPLPALLSRLVLFIFLVKHYIGCCGSNEWFRSIPHAVSGCLSCSRTSSRANSLHLCSLWVDWFYCTASGSKHVIVELKNSMNHVSAAISDGRLIVSMQRKINHHCYQNQLLFASYLRPALNESLLHQQEKHSSLYKPLNLGDWSGWRTDLTFG